MPMAEVLASRDTQIQLISQEFQMALVEHKFKVYKEKRRLKEERYVLYFAYHNPSARHDIPINY